MDETDPPPPYTLEDALGLRRGIRTVITIEIVSAAVIVALWRSRGILTAITESLWP